MEQVASISLVSLAISLVALVAKSCIGVKFALANAGYRT